MPNVTISIDEELIKAGRQYAKNHNLSLNALIRKLLKQTVENSNKNWLEGCFGLMDMAKADSKGEKWLREDLYNA